MKEKGLIHIYTGYGKGKTTCGVGLALRALGHQRKVVYCFFHKEPEKYGYNEIGMLEKCGAQILGFAKGTPLFNKQLTTEQLTSEVKEGLKALSELLKNQTVDVLIMDEILISVRDNYITEEELIQFMAAKPKNTELVLTGRDATDAIKGKADYVSNIQKEKHPYDNGIMAREGIEF